MKSFDGVKLEELVDRTNMIWIVRPRFRECDSMDTSVARIQNEDLVCLECEA